MKLKIFLLTIVILVVATYQYYLDLITEIIWIKNALYLRFIFIICIAIVTTLLISKIVDYIFYKAIEKIIKHDSLAKKLFPVIHNIITIAIWIIAVFTTAKILWYNINTLLTWAWISWILIALASKEFISNLFGSLSLIFSKSFKLWDKIKVKLYEWTVDEITLSYTRLVDKRWNYIYMPNKNIITENIENFSHGKFKKQEIILPVPIDTPRETIDKLIESLEKMSKKLIKDEIIEKYDISFNSFENWTQNIGYSFQCEIKSDTKSIKNNIYFEIRSILDKQEIKLG